VQPRRLRFLLRAVGPALALGLAGCSWLVDSHGLTSDGEPLGSSSVAAESPDAAARVGSHDPDDALHSTDPTPTPPSPSATTDATTDPSAEASVDASGDAMHADAGSQALDAAVDAGLVPKPLDFCSTRLTPSRLCDDFDVATLGARWSAIERMNGGALALDTQSPKTAPRAMLVSAPAGSTGAVARLSFTSPGKPRSVHAEFDLRAESVPTTSALHIVGFPVTPATGFYHLDLAFAEGTLLLIENDNDQRKSGTKVFDAPPVGVWVHLVVDVTYRGPGVGQVVVTLDGQQSAVPIASPEPAAATSTVTLGLYASVPTLPAPVQYRVDDFVYDVTL
jgi:hypothetical protein